MNIKTKFNLGDTVYPVRLQCKDIKKQCPLCKGVGKVRVVGSKLNVICPHPQCFGGIMHTREKERYRILDVGKVGRISAEQYSKKYSDNYSPAIKITYMLSSTGVRGGSIWKEDELFATKKEAQAYTNKMNKKK